MTVLIGSYDDKDGLISVNYSVKAGKDGSYDPADIDIVDVTIFGISVSEENLRAIPGLRKSIKSLGAEVGFEDEGE